MIISVGVYKPGELPEFVANIAETAYVVSSKAEDAWDGYAGQERLILDNFGDYLDYPTFKALCMPGVMVAGTPPNSNPKEEDEQAV